MASKTVLETREICYENEELNSSQEAILYIFENLERFLRMKEEDVVNEIEDKISQLGITQKACHDALINLLKEEIGEVTLVSFSNSALLLA